MPERYKGREIRRIGEIDEEDRESMVAAIFHALFRSILGHDPFRNRPGQHICDPNLKAPL
jgi:hypothetical protein